jgi:hypothetical protein
LRIVIAKSSNKIGARIAAVYVPSVEDQDYQVRFTCTGKMDKLTITLEPPRLTPDDLKMLQAAEVSAADAHQLRDVKNISWPVKAYRAELGREQSLAEKR